ncbi:MAG: NAD-dependent epimerase/dehydratase family protein [Candidatus Yanofskybacteria bacterium]|nr:NAD-dependent epimerase/dehydratase family protein [Candidatus Yanofskybacteria bacterium]
MAGSELVSLVTGAAGFVGSHLTRQLVHDGFRVHAVVRSGNPGPRLYDVRDTITVHPVDLRDESAVRRLVRIVQPEYIFHTAAAGFFIGQPLPDFEYTDSNVTGTMHLLSALRQVPYQCFINTGSSSEYGIKDVPMREDDICKPNNAYAISKLRATRAVVAEAHSYGKPVLTLRLFSPFGPFDDPRRFIPEAIQILRKNQTLTLSNPQAERDYIFIDDVVSAYIYAMQYALQLKGEVFNIGSGIGRPINTVAQILKYAMDSKSLIKEPREMLRPIRWQADITKARNLLHWKPKISFEDGIKRTITHCIA